MEKIKYSKFINWKKEIKKTDYFIDIGCWSGATVLEMKDKCQAYGADINKEKLALANKKIQDRVFYCDITKKKPCDKKFDWILFSEVLEHISEEDQALKNISESLKQGGNLILTTPRSIPFFEFWDPAWVKWKFDGKERHYHYSLQELNEKLLKYNLKIKTYALRGNFVWVIRRWGNVFLQYLFKSKKKIKNPWDEGFTDLMILAEKIK